MATRQPPPATPASDSDYGSDLDSEAVLQILYRIEDDKSLVGTARLPALLLSPSGDTTIPLSPPNIDVASNQGSGTIAREGRIAEPPPDEMNQSRHTTLDERSPLERFRTSPKKPLSVTDVVSPAWCELQYWYTLTKHGRKRRTPAMKQGTKVHKKLEDQVHKRVEMVVQSREDAWGLKIWNIIQGLRTLRQTGHTRELEVWGVIDGEIINGIIDEVSYTCPDKGLEELALARHKRLMKQSNSPALISRPEQAAVAVDLSPECPLGETYPQRKVWITDVKTRGSKVLPPLSTMRSTVIQLMMYRKLLADLATGLVDAEVVFKRYRLRATEGFSDVFVAEFGRSEVDSGGQDIDDKYVWSSSQQDNVKELLAHRSLVKLWDLMIDEFRKTISGPDAIGQVLQAEFRHQQTGDVLGSKTIVFDESTLSSYLSEEMKWWRGEREAKGVDIEEAFKCRVCEFAEECDWRKEKIEDAVKTHRKKRTARSKSVV